jgi:ATP-dependent Clp protease ATP-binding subunit ClpB
VFVGEPSVEDTIGILRGLKERYEVHHGVRIQDSALVAAAVLSDRYITDRFLPDKAIDLIDEAASRSCASRSTRCRPRSTSSSGASSSSRSSRWPWRRRPTSASKERLEALDERAGRAERPGRRMKAALEQEKEAIDAIRELKEEARDSCDPARARDRPREGRRDPLRHASPSSSGASRRPRPHLDELQARSEGAMLKEEVDAEDIAEVVAKWTGIPVSRLMEGETQQARPPRGAAAPAGDRPGRRGHRGRQRDPPQPRRAVRPQPADRQSFMFLGPTGVGKTELPGRSPSSCSTTSGRWSAST